MMLLQRGASIDIDVILKTPKENKDVNNKKKPIWRFNPLGTKQKVADRKYPLFQSVVYNEWSGLTFMLLDSLASHGMQFTDAVEAALNTCKYNLALTFMRKQRHDEELRRTNRRGQNLWHVLMLTADQQSAQQKRVCATASSLNLVCSS